MPSLPFCLKLIQVVGVVGVAGVAGVARVAAPSLENNILLIPSAEIFAVWVAYYLN